MIAAEVKYKKTGIDWIPEVPEHWEIVRLKNVAKIVSGATPKSSVSSNWDGTINWVTPAEFGDEMYIGESVRKITKKGLQSCAASLVPVGSIILSNRAPIGSLGISKVELCTNQGCKSIIPTHINNHFLYFLMTLQKENLNVLGNGTTFRELATPSLRNYKIPLPPIEEQDLIANHLFSENEKITHFIQTKQRFIELIKEQRQSIIDEILNPEQNGWKWLRLKNVSTVNDETIGDETDDNFILKYIDIGNVNSNGQIESLQEISFRNAPSRARRVVRNGDVIISTVRTYLKAITLISSEEKNLIASTGFAVLRPKENIISKFLNNVLHTSYFINSVTSNSYGVSYPAITATSLSRLKISIPKAIEEQKQIVKNIKTETQTLDNAISKAEREIELIKEYREAMIAEAVTGKMKL